MTIRSLGAESLRRTQSPMTVYGFPQIASGRRLQEVSNNFRKEPTSGQETPSAGHTASGCVAT